MSTITELLTKQAADRLADQWARYDAIVDAHAHDEPDADAVERHAQELAGLLPALALTPADFDRDVQDVRELAAAQTAHAAFTDEQHAEAAAKFRAAQDARKAAEQGLKDAENAERDAAAKHSNLSHRRESARAKLAEARKRIEQRRAARRTA